MPEKKDTSVIKEGYERWNGKVEEKLSKQPERKKPFSIYFGHSYQAVLYPLDSPEARYLDHASVCRFCHGRGVEQTV